MDLCDAGYVRELMNMFGLTFRKEWGQNFLTDSTAVENIAEACGSGRPATVLEIGAGAGALTVELAKRYGNVVAVEIDRGLVTFVDGTTDTFSGEGPQVDTEMYKMAKDMISTDEGKAYYAAWNGGHIHTAEAVADKAATCTESGYTGRTYCEVCKSIVDWGTTVPATGHSYDFVDGVLKCKECGESYPLGTGLFTVNGKYYYVINGKLETGWRMIDNEWYFFQNDYSAAVGNDVNIDGYYYGFDDTGVLVSGSWADTDKGRQ